MIVVKVLRRLRAYFFRILEITRLFLLKLIYPNLNCSLSCKIARNCSLKCTDGAKLSIINSSIAQGTTIHADHGANLKILNTTIGLNCVIVARERIEIHCNCQIAEMVVIRDQNHNFGAPGKTVVQQGFTTAPVIIEENVWLGAKVTVLAGSHIGKNTVVGANSVVRGKLAPNAVYAGIPAKKIRTFEA